MTYTQKALLALYIVMSGILVIWLFIAFTVCLVHKFRRGFSSFESCIPPLGISCLVQGLAFIFWVTDKLAQLL